MGAVLGGWIHLYVRGISIRAAFPPLFLNVVTTWEYRRMATASKAFRARAFDANRSMTVFWGNELPDLAECSTGNRAVTQMPSGMEKEEEMVSLRAIHVRWGLVTSWNRVLRILPVQKCYHSPKFLNFELVTPNFQTWWRHHRCPPTPEWSIINPAWLMVTVGILSRTFLVLSPSFVLEIQVGPPFRWSLVYRGLPLLSSPAARLLSEGEAGALCNLNTYWFRTYTV